MTGKSLKKELVRVHMPTVKIITTLLHMKGPMNQTAITLWCHLKYERVSKHLEWMMNFEIIEERGYNGRAKLIGLTERGERYYRKNLSSGNFEKEERYLSL